jgi:hypothetical protein
MSTTRRFWRPLRAARPGSRFSRGTGGRNWAGCRREVSEMRSGSTNRKDLPIAGRAAAILAVVGCALCVSLTAQVSSYGDKQMGPVSDKPPRNPQQRGYFAEPESATAAHADVHRRSRSTGSARAVLRQASSDSGAGLLPVPDAVLRRTERVDRRFADGELCSGQGLRRNRRKYRSRRREQILPRPRSGVM